MVQHLNGQNTKRIAFEGGIHDGGMDVTESPDVRDKCESVDM